MVFDIKPWIILVVALILSVSFIQAGVREQQCPDWGFHLCFAETLNAEWCSGGAYMEYAPFLGFTANTALNYGIPACATYGFFALISVILIFTFLNKFGGWKAALSYFIILPSTLMLLGIPRQLWFNNLFCGVIPFFFSMAMCLAFFTLWDSWLSEKPKNKKDREYKRFTQFIIGAGLGVVLVFSHNYGAFLFLWILVSALISASIGYKAHFVALFLVLIGIIATLFGLFPALFASRALVLFYPLFCSVMIQMWANG